MKLDPATLMLVSVLSGLFLPLVLMGLSRSKETGGAVRLWTQATFVYASGLVCLLMRNALPDVLSIGVGNVLLLLGYAELYQGFRVFFGRSPQRVWQWPVALLYLGGMLHYAGGPDAFEMRVVLASVFLGSASAAIAKELLGAGYRFRVRAKETLGTEHFVFFAFGIAFAANALFLLVRGSVFLATVTGAMAPDHNALFYALSYLIAVFVHILLAAGLPLLLSRRTHRELLSSEASLLKVQRVGRVAYAWLDTHTRVITGNEVFREVLGFPADLEITLDMWLAMVHPDDLPRMRHAATLTQGGVYFAQEQEYRMSRYADRQEIWVEISSQVLSDPMDGHPLLLSILRDITGIKLSELAAIRQKLEAEQASQSKSQFLANMSHEIRTPINAILGMLTLLQNTVLTSRQSDYVGKAEGATQGLLGLINDILDFSKVGVGKMTLELQPFSLDALLRNLAVVLSSNTKNKNIDVLFDIDPRIPDVLVGDALRLQQVLLNLGSNAIKFTHAGQVVIALQCQGTDADGVHIAFSIQDSGIGIAPEHQKLIFEAFAQAEASTTRRFGGTGLGLAISKHLVELMGGVFDLDSVVGEGSDFRFALVFPVPSEIPESLHRGRREPLALAHKVLVVDDNPRAGQVFQKQMQSLGWQSDWVATGPEALALVSTYCQKPEGVFPYPLVLVDWQMPGMDGWALSRALRALTRQCGGSPPIFIMLSSNGRQELEQRSEEEQALVDGFLLKPMTCSMIQDAVQEALSERPGLRKLAKVRSSKRQLAGMRILVVEDNLLNQQVAEELLSNEGALVSMAANGRLGVEAVAAASPPFDVVLMDIQMPVMDGYAATAAIRKLPGPTGRLPIIAMTANAMVGDREACMAAGMDEHIGKPFDMAKLVSQLIRSTGFQANTEAPLAHGAPTPAQAGALPDIAGMDFKGALARMAHARPLYRRTAQEFLTTLSTLGAQLQAQLQAQARPDACMTLHTVKGIAGTLGLAPLAQELGRLEQRFSAQASLAQCLSELEVLEAHVGQAREQLQAAVAFLDIPVAENVPDAGTGPTPGGSHGSLVEALSELADLLAQSDMLALERITKHRALLQSLPDGLFDRLDAAVQRLDFESASGLCVAAMEVLQDQAS